MVIKLKIPVVALLAVAVFGGMYAWFPSGRGEGRVAPPASRLSTARPHKAGGASRVTGEKVSRIASSEKVLPAAPVVAVAADEPSDVLAEEDSPDEVLNETQKALMRELQDALDENDLHAVRKAVSKFLAAKGGVSALPRCMKLAAVEALGWFSTSATSDMVDFAIDRDSVVANTALDKVLDSMDDCSMGDRERANYVKVLARGISDPDNAERLVSQLVNMRNSVKVDTIVELMTTGSATVQGILKEQLELYTEPDVVTLDDVQKWGAENPDVESDNDFYGGSDV